MLDTMRRGARVRLTAAWWFLLVWWAGLAAWGAALLAGLRDSWATFPTPARVRAILAEEARQQLTHGSSPAAPPPVTLMAEAAAPVLEAPTIAAGEATPGGNLADLGPALLRCLFADGRGGDAPPDRDVVIARARMAFDQTPARFATEVAPLLLGAVLPIGTDLRDVMATRFLAESGAPDVLAPRHHAVAYVVDYLDGWMRREVGRPLGGPPSTEASR